MTGPATELRATYRLQLTSEFGFESARALIPYLRDLGVSHVYLSPSLQARSGSTHGYDQVDPSRLSDALGGEAGFRRLAGEAHGAGMGVVLDVVPNHMAAADENRFWHDPQLRERFFDIDPVSGRWRRFFDIDDLAGIRQEDPEVFEATHGYLLGLVREGVIDGLRVDHPDGLADPAGYLERLRDGGARRVWVEKILSSGEEMRAWPVSGSVGYEFLNDVCALFVDPAGEGELTSLWERISGDRRGFGEWAHEAKREQAEGVFAPELDRLARLLDRDASVWRARLVDAVSRLPVYRTYVDARGGRVDEADRRVIAASGMDGEIAQRLLLEAGAPEEFVTRFQQTTPAIMAKGVEDTAFYRYGRLLALNDVGGDPSRFGISVQRFHEGNLRRAERFPEGLLTTMTHDAKRSADVRARIGALASVAHEWRARVERWMEMSESLRSPAGAPDDIERYFIFQTLAGAWPIEPERLEAYLEKALREAKRNTNWVEQNAEWESAVKGFARRLVADRGFIEDFAPFARRLALRGRRAALGQVALKLTSPGIPDIYQGDELEFRALVDPDNRRPVDWDLRQAQLRRLMGGGQVGEDGRKLWLISRLLGLRARRPEPFAGRYEPLDAGPDACAFLRGDGVVSVVALRPDAQAVLSGGPGGRWREVLGGREVTLEGRIPVPRLVGELGLAVFERI
ncbi:MAG TPA: malto-oligosyltrehalose synthase [Solirubrobacteraceae bacterium]|nr:malto-oligosyltrehalose synthase [Solirubrobacteraceae bacterium]